jgi:hypothetical protein
MSRAPRGAPRAATERSWITPRNLLIAGAAVNALALVLAMALGDRLVPLRVGLILTGLALALVGVNRRLRAWGEDVEERAATAAYLALGSFVALLALVACDEAWDSFRLVLAVFLGVGLVGAVLVLLPLLVRRGVILALVAIHFAGILTAVFSVTPPNGVPCWTSGALWTYIYRPYLQFMYLNNAYHFYSPEPGPATQLWFRVSYEVGLTDQSFASLRAAGVPEAVLEKLKDKKFDTRQEFSDELKKVLDKGELEQFHDLLLTQATPEPRWVQFPRRDDYASKISYYRYLAMTESTVTGRVGYPNGFFDIDGPLVRRYHAREKIPYHPALQSDTREFAAPDLSQYREPSDLSAKKYIASYARHVANDPQYRRPEAPDRPVARVKVYRVLHTILSAADMARGVHPEEPYTLVPVYMGEFDREGHLMDPQDPLLYWVVPILQVPDKSGQPVLKDYVAVHAGDPKSVIGDK